MAFVLASGGVKVAKHGNRSVSSRCGCADVLEELNVPLDLKPKESAEDLKNKNFTFLFAPIYHPSFKKLATIRKSIQVRPPAGQPASWGTRAPQWSKRACLQNSIFSASAL